MLAAKRISILRLSLLAFVLANGVRTSTAQDEPKTESAPRVVPSINLAGTWESLQWNLDQFILELKTSGTTLTGTVSMIPGPDRPSFGELRPMEIYDGKIDRERIEFKVKSPDNMRVILFSGTPTRDGFRLTRKVELLQVGANPGGDDIFGAAGPASFVAKRVEVPPRRGRSIIQS